MVKGIQQDLAGPSRNVEVVLETEECEAFKGGGRETDLQDGVTRHGPQSITGSTNMTKDIGTTSILVVRSPLTVDA